MIFPRLVMFLWVHQLFCADPAFIYLLYSSKCVRGRCSSISAPWTACLWGSTASHRQSSPHSAEQGNRTHWLAQYQWSIPIYLVVMRLSICTVLSFLTLHWLLYSSKTIQEIMQQNWNLLHKQNRKCSQGLGWLWIPCFTDGYFRLSHISLKKTLTRTKYIIWFLFYPNALWSLSYIPIFCLCTNVNEKLQINDINWNGQNKN